MNHRPANQKDRNPVDTVQNIREILTGMGISLYESSWNSYGHQCFSVRLVDAAFPAAATNGKGITRELALASAYGGRFPPDPFSPHHKKQDYFGYLAPVPLSAWLGSPIPALK